jgi:23S rRNA pseudouridine1911/1915/1917 synthase
LVGDRVYGARPRPPRGCPSRITAALQGFSRQALHAIRLGFVHPRTGEHLEWELPMERDLDAMLALLRTPDGGRGHGPHST